MTNRSDTIKNTAATLQIVSLGAAALALATHVWLWASSSHVVARLGSVLGLPADLFVGPAERALGFAVSGLPVLVLLFALYKVHRLFSAFGQGEILTRANAGRLKHIALAVGFIGATRALVQSLLRTIVLGVPFEMIFRNFLLDLLVVLFAGIFFALGLVLDEAARLREDNDQIV